jgi:hypothetical protein
MMKISNGRFSDMLCDEEEAVEEKHCYEMKKKVEERHCCCYCRSITLVIRVKQ